MDHLRYNVTMNVKAIGGFVKGARLARNMKPEQLSLAMAELLGRNVGIATIYKVERGDINLGLDLLMAMLHILKADPRPLVLLAQGDRSAVDAEKIGRMSILADDTAWVNALSEEQREKVRQMLDEASD